MAAFSPALREEHLALKRFLFNNLYRHYKVVRMGEKARRLLRELFEAFTGNAKLLPSEFHARAETGLERAVCDYIAGMTDRYAILEHRRLFDIESMA